MVHIDISKRLKELISLKNMNVKEFAEYVGISRTSLTGYLNQKVSPTIDPLVQICQKCNVSLDWLCSMPEKRHFLTVADIIHAFIEFNELSCESLTIEVCPAPPSYPPDKNLFICSISFNGRIYESPIYANDVLGHMCTFLSDWQKTKKQLENLSDKEIITNYKQMWLDKQYEYYSSIPVIDKNDAESNLEYLAFLNDTFSNKED